MAERLEGKMVRRSATILAMIAMGCGAPAAARKGPSAEDQLRQILRCNGIADQQARVTCYDGAAKQAMDSGAAPATSAAVAAPTLAPEQAFGLENVDVARRPQRMRPETLEQVSQPLIARLDDGRGYWLFRLANGSTWQMAEHSEFEPPRAGDTVTIRRGLLGSYRMDFGKSIAVRVLRLQ
jgi:hypothetical protein